jgi:hypothetical protein
MIKCLICHDQRGSLISAHEKVQHYFHKECLVDWLAVGKTFACPMCNEPISKELFACQCSGSDDLLLPAVRSGSIEFVGIILKNMKSPQGEFDKGLHLAAELGNIKMVELLLDSGADYRSKEYEAYWVAGEKGNLHIMRFIIDRFAHELHQDDEWALRYAAELGILEVVKELVEDKNCDVHVLNDQAILLANRNDHQDVVDYLQTKGCQLGSYSESSL